MGKDSDLSFPPCVFHSVSYTFSQMQYHTLPITLCVYTTSEIISHITESMQD